MAGQGDGFGRLPHLLSQDEDVRDLADRGEDLEEGGQDSQAVRPGQVVEVGVRHPERVVMEEHGEDEAGHAHQGCWKR